MYLWSIPQQTDLLDFTSTLQAGQFLLWNAKCLWSQAGPFLVVKCKVLVEPSQFFCGAMVLGNVKYCSGRQVRMESSPAHAAL